MTKNSNLGGKYGDFTNFTLNELMKNTGFDLFQALSPFPQAKMNVSPSK